MPYAAPNLHPEYWSHPQSAEGHTETDTLPFQPSLPAACSHCQAEFLIGAHFCHICGAERRSPKPGYEWVRIFELGWLGAALGVPAVTLVCGAIGLICMVAAIFTGFLFSAETVLDWQAIQLWRIQWILGGIAAFLFGILLKRPAEPPRRK